MGAGKTMDQESVKVLITGNEGYIGSVLVGKLKEAGYVVHGLDNGVFSDAAFIPRRRSDRQIYKDVRDIEVSDLEGVEMVVHLAGLSNDPLGELDAQLTYDINYRASVRLAEIAKRAGVRKFLFSSSCSMYGVSGGDTVNENDALDPRTVYAKSKVMVEEEVKKMRDDFFAPVFLRNATVFGVSPKLRLDLVVNDLTQAGYYSGSVDVLSDGTPWRPHLHIDDVCEAFTFFLGADPSRVGGESYNIGCDENNMQIRAVAEVVAKVLPGSKVNIKGKKASDERTYKVGFTKLAKEGCIINRPVKQGVAELVGVFKEKRDMIDGSVPRAYITLRQYQYLMERGVMGSDMRMKVLNRAVG